MTDDLLSQWRRRVARERYQQSDKGKATRKRYKQGDRAPRRPQDFTGSYMVDSDNAVVRDAPVADTGDVSQDGAQ